MFRQAGGQELGETPTLYERAAPKPSRNRDADTSGTPRRDETAPATGGVE